MNFATRDLEGPCAVKPQGPNTLFPFLFEGVLSKVTNPPPPPPQKKRGGGRCPYYHRVTKAGCPYSKLRDLGYQATQRILSTYMRVTYPNHNSNSCYRNPTFYDVGT